MRRQRQIGDHLEALVLLFTSLLADWK